MEASEFRRKLAGIIGDEEYRKFLRALHRTCRLKGRFLFWQEDLLHNIGFSASTSEKLFEELEPLLRVCELHNVELQPDPSGCWSPGGRV